MAPPDVQTLRGEGFNDPGFIPSGIAIGAAELGPIGRYGMRVSLKEEEAERAQRREGTETQPWSIEQ